jgi:hypothetical protein
MQRIPHNGSFDYRRVSAEPSWYRFDGAPCAALASLCAGTSAVQYIQNSWRALPKGEMTEYWIGPGDLICSLHVAPE